MPCRLPWATENSRPRWPNLGRLFTGDKISVNLMLLIYASYFWMEKGAKHCTSLSHSWRFQLFSSCSSSRSQSAAPLSVKGCMEIQHAPGLVHRWRSWHAPMAGKKQFRMAVLQSCGEKVCFALLVTWKISKILPRGWWMNLWSEQKKSNFGTTTLDFWILTLSFTEVPYLGCRRSSDCSSVRPRVSWCGIYSGSANKTSESLKVLSM